MGDENLSKLINTAIQREEEAYLFYMSIYEKIIDSGIKDTIQWIAGEEKKHREFLVNYRDGGFNAAALEMKDVVYYKIAEHMEEPEVKADMPSSDFFLLASHRELKSYHFYTDLADLHPAGETRDILRKMANEELKHKEKMEYLYANTAFPQTDGG